MELRQTDTKDREEVLLAVIYNEYFETIADYLELVDTLLFFDFVNQEA